ncbi:hypothetical protein FB45DRAFT_1149040 [Roridomyces roridus]|uniref:Uncharacterized protein n=1 Tax=Roridomyces roridus TaxID=1738132 RepID=A0AAD7AZ38_9AGAR|nr:hypothetical protein FB45DRAFT_1149040 [Roridomyces roridus]
MRSVFIPVEQTQILSQACEAVCYGFLMCTFFISLYIHFNISRRTTQTKVLISIACAMYVIATGHFAISLYRTLGAIESLKPAQSGIVAFLGDKAAWHLITADVLFVTQCILADSVAIYRCWILWDRDFRIVAPSVVLLVGNLAAGYGSCQQLANSEASSLSHAHVRNWILAFYVLSVAHNTVTTCLTAFRLWWVDRYISDHVLHPPLYTTILLLIESAALYLILQVMVLAAFVSHSNVQFLFLGSIPPITGITFTLIYIRIGLRSRYRAQLSKTVQQPDMSEVAETFSIDLSIAESQSTLTETTMTVTERISLDVADDMRPCHVIMHSQPRIVIESPEGRAVVAV